MQTVTAATARTVTMHAATERMASNRTASPLTPALSPLRGEGETAAWFMVTMRPETLASIGMLCRGFVMDPMKCMLHEFGRVFQIELGFDVLAVRFIVHREDQGWQIRKAGFEILHQFDAVATFEADVDDGDVGVQSACGFECVRRILGFAADHHVGFEIDQLSQPFAENGMIIDQQ